MNTQFLRKPLAVFVLIIIAVFAIVVALNKFKTPKPPIAEKPKVIGIVQLWHVLDRFYDGLKKGMNDLGYVEGKDVVYDYQNWEQNPAKINETVQHHIDNNADLIYAVGNPSVEAALNLTKAAGKNIPIVYVLADKPVETKIANSLKSSGNNSTGVTNNMSELIPKQLEFLKKINPTVKKLGIYGEGFNVPGGVGAWVIKALKEQASNFGITIVEYKTDVPPGPLLTTEFERIANSIKSGDIDAQMHIPGHFYADQHLAEFVHAKRLKIITIEPILEEMEAGGLYSYSADLFAVGEQSAAIVDKIFQGTKLSDIPIEFPRKNILGINMKMARDINITIPDSVMAIAGVIIEK